MHYPANVGNWVRQAPQPHSQWIYKRNPTVMGQSAMDHITLQLAANAANAAFTNDLHYTARAAVIFGQNASITVNFNAIPVANLVYVYDYVLDRATGVPRASNQVNHNAGRYPKLYTGDNTAAQALFGSQQISANLTTSQSYAYTKTVRNPDARVADFWNNFPKFKVVVESAWWGDGLDFAVEVRDNNTNLIETVRTDLRTGTVIYFGHTLNQVNVRVSGILDNWTAANLNTVYADAEGRLSVKFV